MKLIKSACTFRDIIHEHPEHEHSLCSDRIASCVGTSSNSHLRIALEFQLGTDETAV